MAKSDGVFIFIGTYMDEASARADYDTIKDLHSAGAVGTYDASVVTKDLNGKVHVNKDEMATRHGSLQTHHLRDDALRAASATALCLNASPGQRAYRAYARPDQQGRFT